MVNILFIHQSAELYGSDKTLFLLLKHLDRTKFNSIVILPNDGPLKLELEKINIEVYISPVLKLYRNIFTPKNSLKFISEYKSAIRFLDELHKENKFDLVYSNTLAVLLGMLFSKRRKIKHIWHVHEIIVHPKVIATIFPKLVNKYADIVVCNSKATLENLVIRKPQIKSKSIVIYNGIEQIELNTKLVQKEDLGFNNSDIIIALIGRINRLKGHKLLIESYCKYFKNKDNIKLLFVGSPVTGQEFYVDEIKEIINIQKIEEQVKILPFTNDLNTIWHLIDIVTMPSTEAESFGLVAAEAMLAKKPVIGSNHGGLMEIIVDKETGFLVKPNNSEELAFAIQKLIDDEELRIKFGENGFQRVSQFFSSNQYISNFETLFTDTINNKNT